MELRDLRHEATGPGVTLDEDKYETLPDGRKALIGRAGQTIPLALAQRHGLAPAPGPDVRGAETKAPAPAAPPAAPKGRKAPEPPAGEGEGT